MSDRVDTFELELDEDDRIPPFVRGVATRTRQRPCFLCDSSVRFSNPARHTLTAHLPWYFAPHTACWKCGMQEGQEKFALQHIRDCHANSVDQAQFSEEVHGQKWVELMTGLFFDLASILGVSYPEGLVQRVNQILDPKKYQLPAGFTEKERSLARLFLSANFPESRVYPTIKSTTGFRIDSLIHWKVTKAVLHQLDEEVRGMYATFEERKNHQGVTIGSLAVKPSGILPIADAHFHLDQLMKRARCSDLHELDDLNSSVQFPGVNLKYLVTNYCYPDTFPSALQRSNIRRDERIYFTYGLHPRLVSSTKTDVVEGWFDSLKSICKSTRTVAIGECGLDTTDSPATRNYHRQIRFLEKQLELAHEMNLPVVIHCRGDFRLHQTIVETLSVHLQPQHPIHWHCFLGNSAVYTSAVQKFSNIVFGITPFILHNRKKSTITEFLAHHGINKIVLESDAPYISTEQQEGSPYQVYYVANEVSRVIQIPIEEVLKVSTRNVRRTYRLE